MNIKHIDLEVEILPNNSEINCIGSFKVANVKDELFFHLNNLLEIKGLYMKKKDENYNLTYSPSEIDSDFFIKTSRKWIVKLPEDFQHKDELVVYIKYQGKIEQDEPYKTNYLTPEAIELAIYVAWYPIIKMDDNPTFTVILTALTNWTWIMNAEKKKIDNTKNGIQWERKDEAIDLVLLGRPIETAITEDNSEIFWGNKKYLNKFKTLEKEILGFKNKLEDWLGKPNVDSFKIALNSRETGGTYVRKGLISTQGSLPEEYFTEKKELLLLSWMHEISHLWFDASEKGTYHNWIDEALADYTALIMSENYFGEEFFNKRLATIQERIRKEENLPAIKEITRSHEKSHLLFYSWGSIILHEIRKKIGLESLIEVLKDFTNKSKTKSIVKTQDLIVSLNKITKEEWSDFIHEYISKSPNKTLK